MTRSLLAVVIVLGACARPRPSAPSAPASPRVIAAPSARPAQAAPVPPPPSLLETFDQGDLNRITITEVDRNQFPGCAPKTAPTWIVSATDARGDGATCIGDGSAAPACVMYAGSTPGHVAEVMCKWRATAKTVDVPAWAPRVLEALRATTETTPWEVTPIQDAVRPAVAIVVDDELFVALRTEAGWRRTTVPQEQMRRLLAHRLIDTTSLTGTTSFGVITSSYSGGSESGTEVTTLTVLRPTSTGLEPAGTIQIGQFTWLLAAEERKRYPNAAGNLEARPHVDVQLTPRIERDTLVLDLARAKISKPLDGRCKHSPDDDDLNAPCILVDRKAAAGRYKLANGDFERVR